MELKVINARENMYILDDGRVRCFLFVGETDALLVDAGFPDTDVVSEVKKLTNLPIRLVLTHGDGDHTGGVQAVGECYVHAKDMDMIPQGVTLHEIGEGDHIGVGVYDFTVLSIPGHTYGSIALLDEKQRMILTGDSVQKNGGIFMFGEKRNFLLYLDSLRKLESLTDKFDVIYPSHSECPIEKEAVSKCLEDATALWEGRITKFEKHPFMPCNVYHGEYTDFLFQPEKG